MAGSTQLAYGGVLTRQSPVPAVCPADALGAAMQHYGRLAGEAGSLLDGLQAQLAQLTSLTAPITERVSVLTWADRNISAVQAAADELLRALDTSRKIESHLQSGPSRDLEGYLEQLSRLDDAMAALRQHAKLSSARDAYDHAQQVHAQAMADCEADFLSCLGNSAGGAGLPSAGWLREQAGAALAATVSAGPELEKLSDASVERMARLGATMLAASHNNVLDAYVQARTRTTDAVMRLAGFEPFTSTSLQAQGGEQLEKIATSWTLQLRVLVLVAASELALARRVWLPPHDEQMACEVLTRSLRLVLQQGRDIADGRRTPESVFALLNMLSHVAEVLPMLAALLQPAASSRPNGEAGRRALERSLSRGVSLVEELQALHGALVRSARTVFADFEDTVANDQSRVQVLDGTIHPLCAHTLSYLKRLFTFPNSSAVLFNLPAAPGAAPGMRGGKDMEPLARTSAQVRAMTGSVQRIVANLEDNLAAKSSMYKDPALARIFLMNNTHYVVATLGGPGGGPLGSLLGTEWVDARRDTVDALKDEYYQITWAALVSQLQRCTSKEDGPPSDVPKLKVWLKDKFNAFNVVLETVYTTQCAWIIPDLKLRVSVRRSTRQEVVPAYNKLWKKFSTYDFSSTPSKYLRYSPEDVEAMIDNDLFEGQLVTLQKVKIKKMRGGAERAEVSRQK